MSSLTLKSFIAESVDDSRVAANVKQLLKARSVEQCRAPRDRAKFRLVGHKWVDTVSGPWVLKKYEFGDRQFIQVDPPKGSKLQTKYFVKNP